jgi:hypothetical protein
MMFVTRKGQIITVHYWYEWGNVFCSVYRSEKLLGQFTNPDEEGKAKPFNITYGESVISKLPHVNVIFYKEGKFFWEVNAKDNDFDPIVKQYHNQ